MSKKPIGFGAITPPSTAVGSGIFVASISETKTTVDMATPNPSSIDAYIADFPDDIQAILQEIRAVIKAAAPEATETINYGIPTFQLNGNLVHFAAFKNHIGFYSTPAGTEAFEKELSVYKTGKGSVQFPLQEQMPLDLIARIVQFRVQQNLNKSTSSI